MVTVVCQGCRGHFEARRASAKWCSDRCRKSAGRRSSSGPVTRPSTETSPASVSDLVRVVRRDLEQAGQVESVDGQLSLRLAEAMSAEDCKGFVALSRQLTVTLARALAAGPVDDEVTRARRRRDETRRELGLDPGVKP